VHARVAPRREGAVSARDILAAAAVLGALAIVGGAFGAHALQGRLGVSELALFDTAARYQLVHAVMLLGLAALRHAGVAVRAAAVLVCVGTVVFSGTLYALALGAPRWLGAVTPVGGTALILGWLALLPAAWRRSPQS